MFSTGFNSGESWMHGEVFRTSLPVLCQPARSIRTTPWVIGAGVGEGEIGDLGQMAPNRSINRHVPIRARPFFCHWIDRPASAPACRGSFFKRSCLGCKL